MNNKTSKYSILLILIILASKCMAQVNLYLYSDGPKTYPVSWRSISGVTPLIEQNGHMFVASQDGELNNIDKYYRIIKSDSNLYEIVFINNDGDTPNFMYYKVPYSEFGAYDIEEIQNKLKKVKYIELGGEKIRVRIRKKVSYGLPAMQVITLDKNNFHSTFCFSNLFRNHWTARIKVNNLLKSYSVFFKPETEDGIPGFYLEDHKSFEMKFCY